VSESQIDLKQGFKVYVIRWLKCYVHSGKVTDVAIMRHRSQHVPCMHPLTADDGRPAGSVLAQRYV